MTNLEPGLAGTFIRTAFPLRMSAEVWLRAAQLGVQMGKRMLGAMFLGAAAASGMVAVRLFGPPTAGPPLCGDVALATSDAGAFLSRAGRLEASRLLERGIELWARVSGAEALETLRKAHKQSCETRALAQIGLAIG